MKNISLGSLINSFCSLFSKSKQETAYQNNGAHTDEDTGRIYPINSREYERYILIRNSSEDYVLRYLAEYTQLYDGQKAIVQFHYLVRDNWMIVKCPNELFFFDYHNIAVWLSGCEKENDTPDDILAVAINKANVIKSYYSLLDPDCAFGDTMIGIFEDGKKFSIYLPDADIPTGNMVIKNNNLDQSSIDEYFKSLNFNPEDIEQFNPNSINTRSYSVEVITQ
jgi:hypothetical protein